MLGMRVNAVRNLRDLMCFTVILTRIARALVPYSILDVEICQLRRTAMTSLDMSFPGTEYIPSGGGP